MMMDGDQTRGGNHFVVYTDTPETCSKMFHTVCLDLVVTLLLLLLLLQVASVVSDSV